MGWMVRFLSSSIGQKLVMSLTGLFLIVFLIIHLAGNLQLLYDDGGKKFNIYAYLMTHNPVIKTISYGLYFFILLHAVVGILVKRKNSLARGKTYLKNPTAGNSWASRNMAQLGILLFVFLCIHMGDFWYKMKVGALPVIEYEGYDHAISNLYIRVQAAYEIWWLVAIYVISMVVLAFHLQHGFQSAFQSLGLRHKKYTPIIAALGLLYSVLVPIGFALIPLYFYFNY